MHIPWALNYLAFSHFTHSPEDTLRQFGRATLGQVLGSEDEGEAFVEHFAQWDSGSLDDARRKDIARRAGALQRQVANGEALTRWRFWNWLHLMAAGRQDQQTASLF